MQRSPFLTNVCSILAGGIGTLILVVTVLPVVYWKMYEGKSKHRGF